MAAAWLDFDGAGNHSAAPANNTKTSPTTTLFKYFITQSLHGMNARPGAELHHPT